MALYADHRFASASSQAIELIVFRAVGKVMQPFSVGNDRCNVSKEYIVVISIKELRYVVLERKCS